MIDEQDLVYRLRERARIRRQIPSRKSVQEGKPDRMSDLMDEAAAEIERLRGSILKNREQKCKVCGATENIVYDSWYGWRCASHRPTSV